MKPIEFKEQNIVIAKDQPQYGNLPAFISEDEEGIVVSCWKLSLKERMRLLFRGKLWVGLWTVNEPLTPSLFSTKKSDLLTTE